jgi:hypothetical protein
VRRLVVAFAVSEQSDATMKSAWPVLFVKKKNRAEKIVLLL